MTDQLKIAQLLTEEVEDIREQIRALAVKENCKHLRSNTLEAINKLFDRVEDNEYEWTAVIE